MTMTAIIMTVVMATLAMAATTVMTMLVMALDDNESGAYDDSNYMNDMLAVQSATTTVMITRTAFTTLIMADITTIMTTTSNVTTATSAMLNRHKGQRWS